MDDYQHLRESADEQRMDRWQEALYGGRLMFHYPLGSVKDPQRAKQADRLTVRWARAAGQTNLVERIFGR